MFRALTRLLGMAAALLLGWVLLVSLSPGTWIAAGAPCPRNLAWGDAWLPRASPLESLSFDLPDGGKGKLCYGRPSLKGRQMIGGELPYGQLWRLGANEPTTLHLSRAAHVGEMVLAPGSYSLYAIPGQLEWEILINRSTRQWGLESEYTSSVRAREVGRIRLKSQPLDRSVETLTFSIQPSAMGAIEIVFEWEDVRWRLPLEPGAADINPFEPAQAAPEL